MPCYATYHCTTIQYILHHYTKLHYILLHNTKLHYIKLTEPTRHNCFSWSPIQIRLSTEKQLRHFFVILHFPIALQNISKIFILVTDFRTVKIVKIQLFVTSLRYFMLRYVIHIKNVTQEQKDGSYEFKLFWNQ